jgi:hypothetical protein
MSPRAVIEEEIQEVRAATAAAVVKSWKTLLQRLLLKISLVFIFRTQFLSSDQTCN